MSELDPLTIALRQLCDREGGYKALAKKLEVHDQSLYQIVTGVKLPSGKPKGVGPTLRKKLDSKYPNWLNPARPADQTAEMVALYGLLLRMVPEKDRLQVNAEATGCVSRYLLRNGIQPLLPAHGEDE